MTNLVPIPIEIVMKAKAHFEKALPLLREELQAGIKSSRKRGMIANKIEVYEQGLKEINTFLESKKGE